MRWYGHLKRRDGEEHVGREAMEMEVEGTRGRGRPKTRWKGCIRNNLREKNIVDGAVRNRSEWRRLIRNGDPEYGKAGKKKYIASTSLSAEIEDRIAIATLGGVLLRPLQH